MHYLERIRGGKEMTEQKLRKYIYERCQLDNYYADEIMLKVMEYHNQEINKKDEEIQMLKDNLGYLLNVIQLIEEESFLALQCHRKEKKC